MMTKQENILIAYFSWSGNTQTVASQIHEIMGGDVFRIQAVNEYPSNYNEVLKRAKREIRQGEKPELKESISNIEKYAIVFIGYPNWWNTFPAPVRTFLTENTFRGKIIVPFCTHGGGGTGDSLHDISKLCPEAAIVDALSINAYAAAQANNTIKSWLGNRFKTNIS